MCRRRLAGAIYEIWRFCDFVIGRLNGSLVWSEPQNNELAIKTFPMSQPQTALTIPEALAQFATQNGITVAALSEDSPLLLVFLRHFG